MKNAGVEALALTFDAASQNRLARSCTQVGYFPKVMPYPLGVGNEKQFLQGNKWLGNAYVADEPLPVVRQQHPGREVLAGLGEEVQPGLRLRRRGQPGLGRPALLAGRGLGRAVRREPDDASSCWRLCTLQGPEVDRRSVA